MIVENQSDSYGGPVWMADKNPNNDTIACACEDGSIRLFDLSGDRVVYLRSIQMCDYYAFITTRCQDRLVSCSWSQEGSMIACGNGSNHVYIYHFDSGKTDSFLVSQERGENIIIWNVRFISSTKYPLFSPFILDL
jgi:U3 small nucleolar RNA-associated protein 4